MPIILGLLAAAGIAIFWLTRARQATEVAAELADVASTVMNAARRFGFRRQANMHPVESIQQPNLAIGGLAVAFMQLGSFPTAEQQQSLTAALGSTLSLTLQDAEETVILGNWFVTECGGPVPAISRLSRKLNKLGGAQSLNQAMQIIKAVSVSGGGDLSDKQKESLAEISRIFRLA